jgi:hypothetical protein
LLSEQQGVNSMATWTNQLKNPIDFLLLEDNDFLLLESDFQIILEQTGTSTALWTNQIKN